MFRIFVSDERAGYAGQKSVRYELFTRQRSFERVCIVVAAVEAGLDERSGGRR